MGIFDKDPPTEAEIEASYELCMTVEELRHIINVYMAAAGRQARERAQLNRARLEELKVRNPDHPYWGAVNGEG